MAKDIILYIISQLGTDVALYKAIEYTGKAVTEMSLDERLVLCNMSVEMGAKATYIKPDKKVWDYLSQVKHQKVQKDMSIKQLGKKENEVYESVYNFDINKLEPQIAL